jgi:hypothetical protein
MKTYLISLLALLGLLFNCGNLSADLVMGINIGIKGQYQNRELTSPGTG